MTNQNHRIALVPGDGIGTDVLPPAGDSRRSTTAAPGSCRSGGAYYKAKDKSF
jgi:hypothetical protein